MTKAGLIGKKLGHSLSPFVHQSLGGEYSLYEVQPENLKEFFEKCDLDGFNVTIPYKRDVLPFLDEIDETAQKIGVVNTVCKRNGRFFGYNTDADGMIYALKRANIELKDKIVAILGTGGTSETAFYVANKLGAKTVFKVGRTSEINYINVYSKIIDVIINTTPLGTFPQTDGCPVDLTKMPTVKAVFDAVYNPINTQLVLSAKRLGIVASNGLAMLVEQARIAHNHFENCDENNEKSTEIILNKLYKENVNLFFIGMPGAGKSSIAKEVAKRLKLPLIDLDDVISKKYGAPESLILEKGESAFREIERTEAKLLDSVRKSVIALGGGTVMNEQTAREIKRNGKVILISRDLANLSKENRPISEQRGVEELFRVRQPIYQSLCDFEIQNDNFEKTVEGIVKYYENITY